MNKENSSFLSAEFLTMVGQVRVGKKERIQGRCMSGNISYLFIQIKKEFYRSLNLFS